MSEQKVWTTEKPCAPGAFWIRGNGLERDSLIEVINDNGELWCNLHLTNTNPEFGYGYLVDDLSPDFEWCGPLIDSQAQYTALDMTTAAAQGFRDGVASKSEPCDGCFMAEAEALRKNSERYLHLKAAWDDGLLLERLGGNVLPADWDAEIDKDISKEV